MSLQGPSDPLYFNTFLQSLSLAWGEDSPVPVAGPWMGAPRSLRAILDRSHNSCKGEQWLTVVGDGDTSGLLKSLSTRGYGEGIGQGLKAGPCG